MKQLTWLLVWILAGSLSHLEAQDLDDEREVVQLVEHFVDLTSQLRLYALEQYMADDANVIVARATKSGFVNRVVAADQWLSELNRGLMPIPFREALSNVHVFVTSSQLAVVRADFEIVRDDEPVASGVDVFTLVRLDGQWTIASIAYTSIPE
jgi:hypothetical protein